MQLAAPNTHQLRSTRGSIDVRRVIRGARCALATLSSLGRFAISGGRAKQNHNSDSGASKTDGSLLRFQNSLTDAHARIVLRERLARRRGNECFEFLIAARCLEQANNPLQRYQLLSGIVHRFIRVGAERPIPISDGCRREMLCEWVTWAEQERVPARLRLKALEAATIEINTLMVVGPDEALIPLDRPDSTADLPPCEVMPSVRQPLP